jgi:hypothetical protein
LKRTGTGSSSSVGPLLKQFLGQHSAFVANPIGDWGELVGEQVARYTHPKSLKNKVLVIAAHDSVWKHHLEQLKEVLADKINAKRTEPIVDQIVIKVAELPTTPPVLNPTYASLDKLKAKRIGLKKKQKAPVRKLTPDEQQLLKNLPDADLRELGAKLLKRIPSEDQ